MQVVEWMAENRVLSVALEGNIDQVQYTDRIKSIVEFLGTRLSNEELSKVSCTLGWVIFSSLRLRELWLCIPRK